MYRKHLSEDYENDFNGLWSWYLNNLRRGEFEELAGNTLKNALLHMFLKDRLKDSAQLNKRMLLVSIPEELDKDLEILEESVLEHLQLRGVECEYIEIIKLTGERVYNQESHYLLEDRVTNFNDSWFLEMKRDMSINTGIKDVAWDQNCANDKYFIEERDENYSVLTGESFDEEDGKRLSFNCKNDGSSMKESNNVIKLEHINESPISSILDSPQSHEDLESYVGEVLVQTFTRGSDTDPLEDNQNFENDVFDSDDDFENDEQRSYSSTSTGLTNLRSPSFPSSMIIDNGSLKFRMMLQSILISNRETNQLFTAIRQHVSGGSDLCVSDDWLLYDSSFRLDNLQMLSLDEIMDFGRFFPKILFFSFSLEEERGMVQRGSLEDSSNTFPSNVDVSDESVSSVGSVKDFDGQLDKSISINNHEMTNFSTGEGRYFSKPLTKARTIGSWKFKVWGEEGSFKSTKRLDTDSESMTFMSKIKSQPLPTLLPSFSSVENEKTKLKNKLGIMRANRNSRKGAGNLNSCVIV